MPLAEPQSDHRTAHDTSEGSDDLDKVFARMTAEPPPAPAQR